LVVARLVVLLACFFIHASFFIEAD
jgi:hypothetical protein